MFADILHKTDGLLTIHATAHGLKDVRADMLQWQVNVMANLWILAHQVEKLIGKTQRIAVMKADPLEAVDVTKGFHQLNNVRFAVNVVAVIRQVLCDKNKLFHALFDQSLSLLNQVGHRHRDMAAADQRDGAKSATAVAPLRDL